MEQRLSQWHVIKQIAHSQESRYNWACNRTNLNCVWVELMVLHCKEGVGHVGGRQGEALKWAHTLHPFPSFPGMEGEQGWGTHKPWQGSQCVPGTKTDMSMFLHSSGDSLTCNNQQLCPMDFSFSELVAFGKAVQDIYVWKNMLETHVVFERKHSETNKNNPLLADKTNSKENGLYIHRTQMWLKCIASSHRLGWLLHRTHWCS